MAIYDRKDDFAFIKWAQLVKKRDHFTCQVCERRGIELNSHHLNAWNLFPDERYLLSNGICLCVECHEQFHELYGHGNNTKLQFEEYRIICDSIINSSKKNLKVESILKDVHQMLDGYGQSRE